MSKLVQNDARDKKRIRDESLSTNDGEPIASSTRAGAASNKKSKVTATVPTGKRGSTAVITATAADTTTTKSTTDGTIVVVSKTKGTAGEKKKAAAPAPAPASVDVAKTVTKAPAVAKKATKAVAVVAKKVTKAAAGKMNGKVGTSSAKQSKVVYAGHIPHGFYEKEIYRFFAQFGEVKRVKLFRSQKTNGSKGYAFIEFADASIAIVAAEAMNGYFLSERQLVCHVVPPSELHKGMFARPKATPVVESEDDDEEKEEDADKAVAKAKKSLAAKQKKLKALGIDYDFLPI